MAKRNAAGRARWSLWISVLAWVAVGLGALPAGAQDGRIELPLINDIGAVPAGAQSLTKLDTSLQWVPENAAYYSATLRLGEQIQAVCKSRAWASLKAMPAVKKGIQALKTRISEGDQGAQIQAVLENPEFQNAMELFKDMFSQEVFVCGDPATVDFIDLVQRVASTVQYGPQIEKLMTGQAQDDAMGKLLSQGKLLLTCLADNRDLIKVPSTIIGFKVRDRDRAVQSLAKLEGIVNILSLAQPKVNEYFKRQKVAGNEYLTLTLRGSEIPWDQLPLEQVRNMEARPGDVDKLVEKGKQLNLVISLGLRKDYLILAIGPSTELLARLGEGKSLAARPEFQPLAKFADRRLVAIQYVSRRMAARVMDNSRQIDDLLKMVNEILPRTDLSTDQKAEIRKDTADLAKDIKTVVPAPGATMGFDFITDRGIEGYTYQWGKHPGIKAKPLGLAEHVGGRPILALVGPCCLSIQSYDLLVKWVKIAHRYFETYGLPEMGSDEQEQYKRAMDLFRPIIARFDGVNRTSLIPAVANGQLGLVLDAKLASRQFLKCLPATEKPMPMIEAALVVGVSDAAAFRTAMAAYREMANAVIDAVRQLAPGQIPDEVKIPQPQTAKSEAGSLWSFPLPADLGVTAEIAPTMGLSNSVAVFAVTQEQARRLLAAAPCGFGGVLAEKGKPRAAAAGYDHAALMDVLTPWAELGVRELLRHNPEVLDTLAGPEAAPAAEKKHAEKPESKKSEGKKKAKKPAKKVDVDVSGNHAAAEVIMVAAKPSRKKPAAVKSREQIVMDQLHTVLNALKSLRSVTVEITIENGVLVTHWLMEIHDIE